MSNKLLTEGRSLFDHSLSKEEVRNRNLDVFAFMMDMLRLYTERSISGSQLCMLHASYHSVNMKYTMGKKEFQYRLVVLINAGFIDRETIEKDDVLSPTELGMNRYDAVCTVA
ncbi:hypothetical protein PUW25_25500 (plasmid) [Paenibacillus urinalis]|uniref:MarR family transcriptional regulator n=1 Tax=Paenibacillus urinalis TaxID=521520 RepID=A0ABY7XH54_9BACL|nr:hypothetical protein [Paenibacillus urinalis]WDI05167.1 hypothetical protein PUW25_25500 [Paenibacillus urinalis]